MSTHEGTVMLLAVDTMTIEDLGGWESLNGRSGMDYIGDFWMQFEIYGFVQA
jgi:hypothetical protein